MARHQWLQLPEQVRDRIARRAGTVCTVQEASAGSVADLAVILTTESGRIFCKGSQLDSPALGQLRNEVRFNRFLPDDLAPRLRWSIEDGGWLLAAFDYAGGRHVELSPGSPDLAAVAATLTRMSQALTPFPAVSVQPATERWGRLLDPALIDGDTFLHTDVTPRNFLIEAGQVRVVDWSMPCRGAAWLDTARMIVRLIRAGHTPEQAEAWATGTVPMWAHAPSEAVDAFARAVAKLSRKLRDRSDAAHLGELADAAARWASYRTIA